MEELIVRLLSGEATAEEAREVEGWRRASAENERRFVELERVWHVTEASPGDPVSAPPALAAIVAEAERRRGPVISLAERRARTGRRWRVATVSVAAAAAAVLVAIGIATWRPAGENVLTAAGEYRTVTLADGSVARLAPKSALEIVADGGRSVRLDGRAFFAVAADSTHPFTVETPSGNVQVLGTRFEVAANPDSLRLLVVEGRVALTSSGRRVEVGRGRVSRVTDGSAPTPPVATDVWALLDWPNGLLIFQATPLEETMAEVERRFGVPFAIADEGLARRTVTAWFEDEPLADVVETICAVVGAQCVIGDVVEVMP